MLARLHPDAQIFEIKLRLSSLWESQFPFPALYLRRYF